MGETGGVFYVNPKSKCDMASRELQGVSGAKMSGGHSLNEYRRPQVIVYR